MTVTAFLTALASVLHWAELFIPSFVPGFRLGLANLPSLFALLYLGPWYYLAINFLKILLVSLFTGFGTSFFLSLGGTILASAATLILYFFTKASIFGMSAVGSFFHVLGQVLVYIWIVQTPYMLLYFPVLAALGLLTGILLALIIAYVIRVVPPLEKMAGVKRKS
jgi:heptaprenyl diphosphate synthase